MKSMNCNSHTGRIPICAAPAAAPMIAASEIGVSITRCSPYLAISPSVTLNAPPYAPMSSPKQKTFWSRSISSNNASRIASRYVTSDIVRPPAGWALVHLYRRFDALAEPERSQSWRVGVDPDYRVGRLRHRLRLGFVGSSIDLFLHPLVDRHELRLFETL